MESRVKVPESIAIYVCTYERNGPLKAMLESLSVAAGRVQPETEIAVVVIDDNPDGRAQTVVDEFDGGFLRGLHYRHSGARNISVARNAGLEAAIGLADWVAMVDDDQVAAEHWIEALIATQVNTNADAVTGPVPLRYGDDVPQWLHDEPFAEILEAGLNKEGERVEVCSTGNSMLRADFLRQHPELRFRPDLGEVGGEDMVFYRAAVGAGLDARYSLDAVCYGEQPPERSTYAYQVWACYWMGNTEFVTNYENGEASRPWLALRGCRRMVEGAIRPFQRILKGNNPQFRFAGASVARGFGTLVGVAGVRAKHR